MLYTVSMDKKGWEIFPELFLGRLRRIVPETNIDFVLDSFCASRFVTFRVNTLKISSDAVYEEMSRIGFVLESVSWYPDAFIVRKGSKDMLMETKLYKNGCLYLQSLSSMIPSLVLDIQSGDVVADVCAAPGSKTSQIAALMHSSGQIVANDKSRSRLYKLEAVLKQLGVTNVTITNIPGQAFWKKYPEYFDKVLVDVPCSMEGMFTSYTPESYKDWSMKKIKMLVQMQRFILLSAISATKPGGVVVYSTCTMSPEENEGIINWVLEKGKNAITVEEIGLPIDGVMNGIQGWNKKIYDKRLEKTLRVLPSEIMEGFYVAKLRKVGKTVEL